MRVIVLTFTQYLVNIVQTWTAIIEGSSVIYCPTIYIMLSPFYCWRFGFDWCLCRNGLSNCHLPLSFRANRLP